MCVCVVVVGYTYHTQACTFFTLQTHQQKEEEDLRRMSGFCGFKGWRISLHKQEGLDWKSAKKNVTADHKVVNPQTGRRKRETLQAKCVAALFVG